MLFNKCGGERAGDTSVVAMRDAALGTLVAMLQCVGDLGAKAYTDCCVAVHRRQRRREKKYWFNIFQMLVQHFLNVGSTF